MQEQLHCCVVGQLSGNYKLPARRGGWEVPNTNIGPQEAVYKCQQQYIVRAAGRYLGFKRMHLHLLVSEDLLVFLFLCSLIYLCKGRSELSS